MRCFHTAWPFAALLLVASLLTLHDVRAAEPWRVVMPLRRARSIRRGRGADTLSLHKALEAAMAKMEAENEQQLDRRQSRTVLIQFELALQR